MNKIALGFLLAILGSDLVIAASTTTVVTLSPPSVMYGEPTTATITVTDTSGSPSAPTGIVGLDDGGRAGSRGRTCALLPESASQSSCSVTYIPNPLGPLPSITLTARYPGDPSHDSSSGSAVLTVTRRSSVLALSPSPLVVKKGDVVVLTAIVTDSAAEPALCCFAPDGTVVWTATPAGRGIFEVDFFFDPPGTCRLQPLPLNLFQQACSIAFRATEAGSLKITASYDGGNFHDPRTMPKAEIRSAAALSTTANPFRRSAGNKSSST